MFDHKEAYQYHLELEKLEGSRLRTIPFINYTAAYSLKNNTPTTMAEAFMESIQDANSQSNSDDLFAQKVELSGDKISLILGEMNHRDCLKDDNLNRLYEDLFLIDSWRAEIPYPQNYNKDKTWTDFNKMELDIRDKIRRELKDNHRDVSFPNKDLRESLLEFKVKDQKSKMLGGVLESIEPDGSYQQPGDTHYQNQPRPMY